jgi:hypothetical protein
MTRQVRNIDQIRSLLRQMDRSVDDARSRREGAPRSISNSSGPQPHQPAFPSPSANPVAGANGPARPLPSGTPSVLGSRPNGATPNLPQGSNGNGNGNGHGASVPSAAPNAPPRLKAKPKRSTPEGRGDMGSMGDPLQDFHKRQAS